MYFIALCISLSYCVVVTIHITLSWDDIHRCVQQYERSLDTIVEVWKNHQKEAMARNGKASANIANFPVNLKRFYSNVKFNTRVETNP